MHNNFPAMPRWAAFLRRLVFGCAIGGTMIMVGACSIFGSEDSEPGAATEDIDQASVLIKDLPEGLPPDQRNARHSPIELRGDR